MNQDQKDIKAAIRALAQVAQDIRTARAQSKAKAERANAEATLLVDEIMSETNFRPGTPEFKAVLDSALMARARRAMTGKQTGFTGDLFFRDEEELNF